MTQKTELSIRTKRLLFVAGKAIAARKVNVESIRQTLAAKNYDIFPTVQDFLEEFGVLKIVYPYDPEEGILGLLILNPIWASDRISYEQVNSYSTQIGGSLCPIGQDNLTDNILFMDAKGKVYIETEDKEGVTLIGESGAEAIENILKSKPHSQRYHSSLSEETFESTIFTKRTSRLLAFSGWSPQYSADISDFEKEYEYYGYQNIFPSVRDFLSRFGGLEIKFPFDPELGIMGKLSILPHAIGDHQSIQPWNEITGKILLPVGKL